ncbi:ferredoxin [Micromonospora sp. DT31]|uniref:ferredoxin n=1 Tax=Micromonospora sp. DT31 TaxID=3393434 RepID=UPI003CED42C2
MSPGKWRVEVDHTVCRGAGLCNGNLPHRFVLINGKSVPITPAIDPDDEVLDAADFCPFGAIRVTDELSGQVLVAED